MESYINSLKSEIAERKRFEPLATSIFEPSNFTLKTSLSSTYGENHIDSKRERERERIISWLLEIHRDRWNLEDLKRRGHYREKLNLLQCFYLTILPVSVAPHVHMCAALNIVRLNKGEQCFRGMLLILSKDFIWAWYMHILVVHSG